MFTRKYFTAILVITVLAFCFCSTALAKDVNPSDYPQKETEAYQISGGYSLPPASENPKIIYQFQNFDHGGMLDTGASNMTSLWYTFNSKGEKDILFVIEHIRTYATFSAGDSYYFKAVNINLHHTDPAIFSKKHLPKIIYWADGKEQTAKMSKIAWLDDTGIVLKIKSSTLDEVFKTTKAVRIEIYRESGETERIRVPLETLKQWKNVMEADLRQIKKDRYDR